MTSTVYETSFGAKVVVPSSKRLMTSFVLAEQGDWFEDEIKFLRKLLKPGMQVIDVGANYGLYTLSMSRSVGSEGKVWAYEPSLKTFEFLSASCDKSSSDNVVLVNEGLSNIDGEATLYCEQNSEMNSLTASERTTGKSEQVKISTLNRANKAFNWSDIDFIKLDAEGEENRILSGGAEFFAQSDPLIMFERKHGDTVNVELFDKLRAMGFSIFRLLPGFDLLCPHEEEPDTDPFLLNLFAMRPGRFEELQQRGFAITRVAGVLADTHLPSRPEFVSGLPELISNTLSADWQPKVFPKYFIALDQYLRSFALPASPDEIYARMMQCRKHIKRLARQATLKPEQRITVARMAYALGERSLGNLALQPLTEKLTSNPFTETPAMACLPALARFDAEPVEEVADLLWASALEAWADRHHYSCYFSGRRARTALDSLAHLAQGKHMSDRMKNRRALLN